jgi:D-serine deaminase-like pyridoxal phosphate-dependent protein
MSYLVDRITSIESPALLLFLPIIRRNLERMIELAGDLDRLRPHVKTHKMPDLIRMLEARGVRKHKCATLAEAEMVARAGGRDVLLAYPLLGPNVRRFIELRSRHPNVAFRATVDHAEAARLLARAAIEAGGKPVPTLVDLDLGMGRTGIAPDRALELYRLVGSLPGLEPDGLHGYDGHLRQADVSERTQASVAGTEGLLALRSSLLAEGLPVPRLVLGGTPTFPIHADDQTAGVECSPGTCLLYDDSYGKRFPDLPFEPAALLLGRVISKPRDNRLCLDIGSKAVAADPQGDRLRLLNFTYNSLGPQSEEHLVVNLEDAASVPLGQCVLAVPTHVCPTCALYREAIVIDDGAIVDRWPITARDRQLQD